jgi:sugar-specific transcriptional regulator TrmB
MARNDTGSEKETLTETEHTVYQAIPEQGISAGKLSKETDISMRRIYKHLRALKGKKLVFLRCTPKVYGLTDKGQQLASVLEGLQQIIEETWSSSQQVFQPSCKDNA